LSASMRPCTTSWWVSQRVRGALHVILQDSVPEHCTSVNLVVASLGCQDERPPRLQGLQRL
jgi:hypothetical protein